MSSVFDPRRTLEQRKRAAANLYAYLFGGGVADTRRMPSDVIDDAPHRTLHRYHPTADGEPAGLPVLLVPPLAATAACFDLRRGCSLAEHLLAGRRRTYLVDYGPIEFADKDLGLEQWIYDIVPTAIRATSADAGGAPVQVVGWCLGGLMSLGAIAWDAELPVNALAMVASPIDTSKMTLVAPLRRAASLTGGRVGGSVYRALGGVPGWLNAAIFDATSPTRRLMKPLTLLQRRDDRDFLAHVEAVDALMGDMYAYPGRTMGQLYHRVFRANEIASGRIKRKDGGYIELANVRIPVMNVAGATDVVAPKAAVHAAGDVLPNAAEVRLPTAPGGHLGVLTGRSAAATTWRYIDEFFDAHAERAL